MMMMITTEEEDSYNLSLKILKVGLEDVDKCHILSKLICVNCDCFLFQILYILCFYGGLDIVRRFLENSIIYFVIVR